MNTASKPMYDWKNIPWKKVFREVFKLQKRIYRASLRGDKRVVRKLQRQKRIGSYIVTVKKEVPGIAKLLRSRMTGNCHVRF